MQTLQDHEAVINVIHADAVVAETEKFSEVAGHEERERDSAEVTLYTERNEVVFDRGSARSPLWEMWTFS